MTYKGEKPENAICQHKLLQRPLFIFYGNKPWFRYGRPHHPGCHSEDITEQSSLLCTFHPPCESTVSHWSSREHQRTNLQGMSGWNQGPTVAGEDISSHQSRGERLPWKVLSDRMELGGSNLLNSITVLLIFMERERMQQLWRQQKREIDYDNCFSTGKH